MTITNIVQIKNPHFKKMTPIKERQDIFVPNIINQNISRRNGMVYLLTGSGGSGKSNLLLNLFKDKNGYKKRFDNIYYFCPSASFNSIEKHPFEKHERVYHELNISILQDIYTELVDKKDEATKKPEPKEKGQFGEEEEEEKEEPEDEKEIEYSCIILDDMADCLKTIDIQKFLSKFIIKSRHLCVSFFITLQAYSYCPKILRKQITYISIFKPKNLSEFESIADEVLNYKKDDALTIFNYVFNEPYSHLDIDTTNGRIYRNFNTLILKE